MSDLRSLGPSMPCPPGEQRLAVPPPLPPICQWAETNLFLPAKETTAPGLFSFYYSPFLREIAESFTDPFVSEITVIACTQGGKTLLTYLCLAYTVGVDPMHSMIVMPNEPTVKRRVAGRIRPIFEANAFLLEAIGGRVESLHIGEATIMPAMNLYLGWAHSAAQLADVPVGLIFADELGKFPPAVGKEADPLNLLRDRQRTFRGRSKLVKLTSPVDEGDQADVEFQEGDKREFHARCPHCSVSHVPSDRNMILDKDTDGGLLDPVVYEQGDYAHYVCPSCSKAWDDYDRHEAMTTGRWAPHGCTVNRAGQIEGPVEPLTRRSYHISAFMVHPRFQSIGDLAAVYVRAQRALQAGNVRPLQHYKRSHLAVPWEQREKVPETERLESHVGAFAPGLLPAGVQAVTIGVDVQQDHVWFMVVGWGYLFEAWLIDAGRIETGDTTLVDNFEPVSRLAARPWAYADAPATLLPSAQTAVDCSYRLDVVEDFCRQNGHLRVIPVRGDDAVKAQVYRRSKVDETVTRYHLNVVAIKDRLFRLLFETNVPGPGYFHLYRGTSLEIKDHFCSEEQRVLWHGTRKQVIWQRRQGGGPNHLWDCCVYATAAAELVGVGRLGPLMQRPTPEAPPAENQSARREGGFLDGLPKFDRT